MPVSRRLRFEILRRDDHACRYCGAKAPDVELTVDHVVPVTLGGSDDPENLVAACAGCNAGKSSISPDAPIVADVAEDALRWAEAMRICAGMQADAHEERKRYVEEFDASWSGWSVTGTGEPVPRPDAWRDSIARFHDLGLEWGRLDECIEPAMYRGKRGEYGRFTYLCGMCWALLRERQDMAQELIASGEMG